MTFSVCGDLRYNPPHQAVLWLLASPRVAITCCSPELPIPFLPLRSLAFPSLPFPSLLFPSLIMSFHVLPNPTPCSSHDIHLSLFRSYHCPFHCLLHFSLVPSLHLPPHLLPERLLQVKYADGGSEDVQFVRGIPISFIQDTLQAILTAPSTPVSPSPLPPSLYPSSPSPLPYAHSLLSSNSNTLKSTEVPPSCPSACKGSEPLTAEPLLLNGRLVHLPGVALLEAELAAMRLSKARSFGLSDAWVQVSGGGGHFTVP